MPNTVLDPAESSVRVRSMEVGDVHPAPFGINLASFFFRSVFLLTLFADRLDGRLSFLLVKVLE